MADGSAQAVVQQIPHFWYDAIGRIVPGAFFVFGVFALGYAQPIAHKLTHYLLHGSAVGTGAALLALTVASWLVGFLLGAASSLTVVKIWDHCWPLRYCDVPRAGKKWLHDRYEERNPEHKQNGRAGQDFLKSGRDEALHLIWTYPAGAQIAALVSKRDAEVLASQSISLAAVILAVLNSYHWHLGVAFVFLVAAVLGLTSFSYYRKRAFRTPLDVIGSLERRG